MAHSRATEVHMKKGIRAVLFLIAALCFILNIGPVVTNGQINAGVITGMGLCAVFLLYGLFFDRINRFVCRLWKKTAGKVLLFAAVLCVLAAALLGGFTAGRIAAYSSPAAVQTEYLIVLGCRVKGTQPGVYLKARLDKAREYLEKYPESKAILSGGQGSDEDISEADCMFRYLTAAGIAPERLILEDASTSTMENFRNSIKVLNEQGVRLTQVTVVTNDFHEYRASKFAEKCGLIAYPYPSETPWTGYVPFVVREVYAVIFQVYLTAR